MPQGQSKRSKNILMRFWRMHNCSKPFEFWHFLLQAEEITLTIGQAFELAYKKFLESKGKDLETQKQSMVMQKRIELLEHENKELKKRLTDVANIKGDNDVKQYMRENNVSILDVISRQNLFRSCIFMLVPFHNFFWKKFWKFLAKEK